MAPWGAVDLVSDLNPLPRSVGPPRQGSALDWTATPGELLHLPGGKPLCWCCIRSFAWVRVWAYLGYPSSAIS
jgi:hypothetical protein